MASEERHPAGRAAGQRAATAEDPALADPYREHPTQAAGVRGAVLHACAPGRLPGWRAGLGRRVAAFPVLALAVPGGGQGLFHDCPVPGCRQPVTDPREPCGTCRELFGGYMARGSDSTGPEAYAARLAERDEAVAAAYARQHAQPEEPGEPEWKPNQLCWVCSARRKCRREPGLPGLWICKDCQDRTKEMR